MLSNVTYIRLLVGSQTVYAGLSAHCCSKQMGIQSSVQLKQAFCLFTDCFCCLINHLLTYNRSRRYGVYVLLQCWGKWRFFKPVAIENYWPSISRSNTGLTLVSQLYIRLACVGMFAMGIPINKLFISLHLHHNTHLGVLLSVYALLFTKERNCAAISQSAKKYLMFMAALCLPRVSNEKEY